jgi:hypothetical protein
MPQLPFAKPGRFYKGNLHLHSTRSDGTLTPVEVIAAYRDKGYDFVALTDHFLPESSCRKDGDPNAWITVSDTRDLRTADFTTLLGAEVHGSGMGNGEHWHIVAVGLPLDFPKRGEGETGAQLAKRAVDAGAWVGMAHPAWNMLTVDDAKQVADFVHTVEIYNHGCAVEVDRGDGWFLSDALSQLGYRLTAYASDDAHFQIPDEPDAFGGWVHVKAESLDPEALLAALKAGDFYASSGPEIDTIESVDDRLIVECPPAVQVIATGNGSTSQRVRGGGISRAEFSLERFRKHGFVRVTVVGEDGGRAWSNPIWLDA